MVRCFLPYYEVFRNLLHVNHKAPGTWLQELELEDRQANEIMSLLWALNTFPGTEMTGTVELALEAHFNDLEGSPSPNTVSELFHTYVSALSSNIIAWLQKAPETDKEDWI